ncbi:MAG TPA: hypothetical protein VII51_03655 [Gaiellaceae bacterium]
MQSRSALAATAVLVTLAFAPAAGANRPVLAPAPPVVLRVVHADQSPAASCSVRRAHASKFERKLLPVACEQPPRSQVKVDLLKHAATNAATALTEP